MRYYIILQIVFCVLFNTEVGCQINTKKQKDEKVLSVIADTVYNTQLFNNEIQYILKTSRQRSI